MNENVKKVLMDNVWYLSTCSEEPNVVPVAFKNVEADGTLSVGAVLLETTLANIAKNGKVAIAACNPATAEAYQIKGTAKLVTEGPVFEQYAKLAEDTFKGAFPAKGALVITVEKVIVATPGPQNKDQLPL